jgi:hypothetical protein
LPAETDFPSKKYSALSVKPIHSEGAALARNAGVRYGTRANFSTNILESSTGERYPFSARISRSFVSAACECRWSPLLMAFRLQACLPLWQADFDLSYSTLSTRVFLMHFNAKQERSGELLSRSREKVLHSEELLRTKISQLKAMKLNSDPHPRVRPLFTKTVLSSFCYFGGLLIHSLTPP